MRLASCLGAAVLLACGLTSGAWGQSAAQSASTTPAVQQAQPWKAIPVPPLGAFHPEQPRRVQLSNGVVLFLLEDHELPFINGFVEMHGGDRDVPDNKAGLVSLYGEAWRTSGTAQQNGDQLDDLLEARAAKVETSGDIDSTSLSWSCLKGDFPQVFSIATDLLLHPKFSEAKLKLAQQGMAAGIVRRNDDASSIAAREAARLVYGAKSPYGRNPEIATVMSVTTGDLDQFHAKTVMPNNMIIGVIGDFEGAEMERTLRAAFEGLPKGTPPAAPKESFAGPTPGVYAVNKTDVNQSNIWVVGLGTERSNPDFYALSVMNQVFSGGFGSRLFQNVRTKLGLAYSVGGAYGASYDHPGIFYTVAATKSATTVETTEAMLAQIHDLKTETFTETELAKSKDELLNSFIFRYDTPDKVLAERAKLEFYGYPADYLERYHNAIQKVTTADLERVAQKYVDPQKLAILVVGNEPQFSTPLSKLGPVHPVDITIPLPPGMRQEMSPGGAH